MHPLTSEDIFIIIMTIIGIMIVLIWEVGLHIAEKIKDKRRWK